MLSEILNVLLVIDHAFPQVVVNVLKMAGKEIPCCWSQKETFQEKVVERIPVFVELKEEISHIFSFPQRPEKSTWHVTKVCIVAMNYVDHFPRVCIAVLQCLLCFSNHIVKGFGQLFCYPFNCSIYRIKSQPMEYLLGTNIVTVYT